jgi:hypothetical protein
MMADSLYSVTAGIKKEGAEIVFMVVGSKTGSTIVTATMGQPGFMEGTNLCPRIRLEAPMTLCVGIGTLTLVDGQVSVHGFHGGAPYAVAESTRPVVDLGNAKRIHHGIVEDASDINGWNGDRYVVE